ncbi:MAG: hypothetical protein B7Z52_07385 [Burkholderiales bacterium 12-64-5]|nr:MAG: hypothetical protein B7Z52_07385 [Burkholderiales bacterium 12-64-5]
MLPRSSDKLTVEIWSDVICPWCWIGVTRLSKALRAFGRPDQVTVVHHAFRLMPGAPPRAVEEVVSAKMGIARERAAIVFAEVEAVAASEGLTYRLAGTFTGDTLDAHRLVKLAEAKGRGHEGLETFYRGYLSEQASVFERESLLDLAEKAGLDHEEAAAVLDGNAFLAEVDADQRSLQALGGNGVPFFLIGGKYAISGAQPQATFLKALQQAWEERPVTIERGNVCGPDGCEIGTHPAKAAG